VENGSVGPRRADWYSFCAVVRSLEAGIMEPGIQLPPGKWRGPFSRPVELAVLVVGVGLVAAGAVAVFTTRNDAGTAALLAVGAVFVALAIVGDRIQAIKYRELEIMLVEQHAELAGRRVELAFRAATELEVQARAKKRLGFARRRWRSSRNCARSA
jgi:hypothetical protein